MIKLLKIIIALITLFAFYKIIVYPESRLIIPVKAANGVELETDVQTFFSYNNGNIVSGPDMEFQISGDKLISIIAKP